ncbi:MAG: beta-N-acetylhexosaminidase [Gammaproteobacteria bacterium]
MALGPLMIDLAGPALEAEDRELLRHPAVGGVILFTRNFVDREQLQALAADIHALRQPRLIVAVDQEGGRVQRFRSPFVELPAARLIGRRFEVDAHEAARLARETGWLMAAELRAAGVDLSFAPVLDLDRGVCDVIGDRAFHEDPEVVGRLAGAFMSGMHDAGMAAAGKHFPGHGAVRADSHVALPVDRREYGDLLDDMRPYERLIGNGLEAVMAAHIVYPEVDEHPAGFSARWLEGELRRQLAFNGAIFCDDLSMQGAAGAGDMPARVQAALGAGCDMLLICNDREAAAAAADEIAAPAEPPSQVRLMRLHGRPAPDREALLATQRWQTAIALVEDTRGKPELTLRA